MHTHCAAQFRLHKLTMSWKHSSTPFLDSERHNYLQYTIGQLLEDSDVRLGWSIGRLLKTCASSSCTLDPYVRQRRAIACARTTWYITEKFTGSNALYLDTLFGAETAESLSTLGVEFEPTVADIARCSASPAARSCLRELNEVSAWVQTKGPHWTNVHCSTAANRLHQQTLQGSATGRATDPCLPWVRC
jgi:hypothetical protein